MMLEKDYDYDSEPGRDFTYDDHGNVIYGRGYIGAPRLPCRSLGLDSRDFVDKYIKINEEIRYVSSDYNSVINYIRETHEEYKNDVFKIVSIKYDFEWVLIFKKIYKINTRQ